jgi:uncharacterized protein GlcG (DUF336 family)
MTNQTVLHQARPSITLDGALAVLAGVRAAAVEQARALAMVVVDIGGNAVATQRMDGAQLIAMPLAMDKAFTAVAADAPTEAWAEGTQPGQSDWGLSLSAGGRFIVFAGGLPLRADGVTVGGLGVSGGPSDVDRACGLAGIAAAGFDLP